MSPYWKLSKKLNREYESVGLFNKNTTNKQQKDVSVYGQTVQEANWALRKKRSLSKERIARLDAEGFKWSKDEDWKKRLAELTEYQQENGHCNVPANYPDNPKLVNWVHKQRRNQKIGKLSEERRKRLDRIKFSNWDDLRTFAVSQLP